MAQATGENQSKKQAGSQTQEQAQQTAQNQPADPNARFKPPASVTDLPAQSRKTAAVEDSTRSSYIVKAKPAGTRENTAVSTHTNTSAVRSAARNAGTKTGTSLPSVRPGSPMDTQSDMPSGIHQATTPAKAMPAASGQFTAQSAIQPAAKAKTSKEQAGQAAPEAGSKPSVGAAPAGAPASPAKSAPLKPAPAKPAVNEPASAPAEVAGNPPSAANASPAQQVGSPSLRRLADLPDLQEDAQPSPSPTSRAEFTTVYDILDKMENMLEEAKSSVFAPSIAKVDREEFIGALDDLKKMLPVQLERASALMRESERRLDAAQTQSNAIVSEAQSRAADVVKEAGEQAEFLAGQENVVAIAQRKAQAIIDQAQAQSDKLVQGANEYSAKVMEALGEQLGHYQQDVQAGIEVLREREREAASKLDQSYAEEQ